MKMETRCCHYMGYFFPSWDLLYALSHRQDSTYVAFLWIEKWLNGSTMRDQSNDSLHQERTIYCGAISQSLWAVILHIVITLFHFLMLFSLGLKLMLLLDGRKEGNDLFNDTLNTFYLRLYGVGHMVKDHSDSEREENHCNHMGYSFRLAARVLLYAPSHRQDSTYQGLCYTRHGALAGMRNSSMGPP